MLSAGKLRHRVTIQHRVKTRSPVGDVITTWEDLHTNIAASIEPLSVREYVNSQAFQSKITARIVIRFIPNLTSDMRIIHTNKRFNIMDVYSIEGFLSDIDSGIEYLTIPVSKGVNDG